MNNIVLLNEYIKSLIDNINNTYIKKNINIIFDGGAFNGGFALGVALYLKRMEHNKLINVHSVSGCSIGSVLAVWYLSGCRVETIEYFENFMNLYKKNMNFRDYRSTIIGFINDIFNHSKSDIEIIDILNGRLYITYYNIKTHKQRVISKFKDREHIIECIIRSSHIPYLMNGSLSYKKKYIDGITPYIINNEHDNLFVKLITLNKCSRLFMVKYENNIHYRLLTGVSDINEFYTTGSSDMCSYVNNWSYFNIAQLRAREVFFFTIISLVNTILYFKSFIPCVITNSIAYNGSIKTLNSFVFDVCERILV